jgi:hypothetical protein
VVIPAVAVRDRDSVAVAIQRVDNPSAERRNERTSVRSSTTNGASALIAASKTKEHLTPRNDRILSRLDLLFAE